MLRNFFAREELGRHAAGQTMVEYALLLFFISIAAIVVLRLLGPQLVRIYTAVNAALTPVAAP